MEKPGPATIHRDLADEFVAMPVKTGERLVKCAILLASPGGRTSESAEVQSDVGPDRAATGTDGVEKRWSSQQRNLPYKVDKGKVLQKQCQQMRNFGSHGAERRSLQQLQMELASNHAPEVRTGVQCVRFSKSKRKCQLRTLFGPGRSGRVVVLGIGFAVRPEAHKNSTIDFRTSAASDVILKARSTSRCTE